MSYTPTEWKDHIVERPNRFRIQDNGDGTVDILDEHGSIIQQGTPVNAANLNKMEQGIKDAHDAIATHLNESVSQQQGAHGIRVQNGKLEWQDGNEWKNIEIEIGGVESGQNANGNYVRFADGTQICWFSMNVSGITPSSITVQGLTIYYTANSWTFPATFISAPIVLHSVDIAHTGFFESAWAAIPTTTTCQFGLEAIKTFSAYYSHLIAIGRWK